MNDVRQLFQDIKNVFRTEGVDIETPTDEKKEETTIKETPKDVKKKIPKQR